MRALKIALISAVAAMPAASFAKSIGFETDLEAMALSDVKIEVMLSESLQHRANNLPKKLSDRGSGFNSRNGFSSNGYYGERDLANLLEEVREEISDDFADSNIAISDAAPMTLRIVLEDVKNNRPTFEQLSREPGLSFESFGTGGAELSGELISETGEVVGTMYYNWYETSIDPFPRSNGTWTDTNRAISRFSSRAAKTLS